MKSIKEKAEENCIKYGNLGNVAYQEFEEGANYVLEQIEEILALKNQYTDKCVFCDDLEWRIEQLKK